MVLVFAAACWMMIFGLFGWKLGASGYDFVEQSCYQIDKDKLGLSMDWSPDIQPRLVNTNSMTSLEEKSQFVWLRL